MWYEFNQNNAGGSWEINELLDKRVWIEAKDAREANRIAIDIGIYFDGCRSGLDCSCCGDRWSEAFGSGEVFPVEYSENTTFNTPEEYAQYLADEYGWSAKIYHSDGQKVSHITRIKS